MAIIFIRTVILYFAILISMRLMGKRQLGELEISEFIVAALIADLAATPLQDIGIPLLNGLLPILIMFCLEIIIAGLNMKSIKLRKLTYGKPEIIIRNGRIDRGSMLRNRFTVDELMQELRDKPLTQIGTHKIDYTRDYMPGTRTCMANGKSEPMELKGQNVMYYELEGGTTFIIRPSGTEPKVKVYIMAKGENKAEAAEKVEALTAAAKEIVK